MDHSVGQLSREVFGIQVAVADVVAYIVSERIDEKHLQIACQILAEAFTHLFFLKDVE